MAAALDSRIEALKEAAALRSLADQVASPVVAGRKSRKGLTEKQRKDWNLILGRVVDSEMATFGWITDNPNTIATAWKSRCKAVGIGAGLFGWLVWNWAFPLLLELAKLWIESRQQGRVSDR